MTRKTMQRSSKKQTAAMWQAIDALDFERIEAKLLHGHRDEVRVEEVRRAEIGYRQFLKLAAKYPDMPVVPSEAVDEFWHMHILDTQRYGSDCEAIFGHMLHHDPYLGIGGAEHESQRVQQAAASEALMMREFGEANEGIGATAAYCVKALDETASAAYCVKALDKAASAAYCVKALDKTASAAYCVKALDKATSAAYCVKALDKTASAAYCVKALDETAAAAYCVRPLADESSAAYCVRPMAKAAKAADAAYCVRPLAAETSAAYCVRPVAPADATHSPS
jgi:hypothetical protein